MTSLFRRTKHVLLLLLLPMGLFAQLTGLSPEWSKLANDYIQPYVFAVEVDYVLVSKSTKEAFGRNAQSYYTRTPTVAVAAGDRIWMSKKLFRSPWEIDADFDQYRGSNDYYPLADSISVLTHDGQQYLLATDQLDVVENNHAVGIKWEGMPWHFLGVQAFSPDENNSLAVVISEKDQKIVTKSRWIKLISAGNSSAPEVARLEGADATFPRLLTLPVAEASGITFKLVGVFLGQSYPAEGNFFRPLPAPEPTSLTPATGGGTPVPGDPAPVPSPDTPQATGSTGGLTPTNLPGSTPVQEQITPATPATSTLPGLEPQEEAKDPPKKRNNIRSRKKDKDQDDG